MDADALPFGPQPRVAPALDQLAQAVISDTTSPAPSRATSRRNGASVTPDIGASTTRFGSRRPPTSIVTGREFVAFVVT